MADKSKIEWTDATWNPVVGCDKVSPGCANCYAVSSVHRVALCQGAGSRYQPLTVLQDNGQRNWSGMVEFFAERLLQPARWRRPRLIFVNSQSDLFHDALPVDAINQVFAAMALAPQHVFQILTKRAENMRAYINDPQRAAVVSQTLDGLLDQHPKLRADHRKAVSQFQWPLPNVALGVSVENQKAFDERVGLLIQTHAALRILSCEPLLGPVVDEEFFCCKSCGGRLGFFPEDDFEVEDTVAAGISEEELQAYRDFTKKGCKWCGATHGYYSTASYLDDIDWVICGGESGDNARPMHPDWARGLRDQCQSASVPFFFKQHGEFRPCTPEEGMLPDGWPDVSRRGKPIHWFAEPLGKPDVGVIRVGKAAAGRLLDGQEWNEQPPLMNLGADV